MIDLKKLVPTKKEKWLRAEAKAATPIPPLKFKFLLEKPQGKEPSFLSRLRKKFLSGKIILPFQGEIPIPTQSCLKKGGCARNSEKLTSFSWLIPPALTFLYQQDDELYKKISSLLLGWIDKNPPLRGIGWESDEAIMARAVIFPLIYDALKAKAAQDKKALKKLSSSIYQHYLYIHQELRPEGPLRSLKLPALIFSGVFLRKFSMPAPDFDLFLEEFISFIHNETDKEGIFKGNSLEEHLFFLETSLYTTLLLAKNKYLIGESWNRLERAARILMEVRNKEGIPPLGGRRGMYLLPLHLLSKSPDFLVSVLCSFHKSSRVGTEVVEGVEVFAKPVRGSYQPRGFCSEETHLAGLRQGDLFLLISNMKSHKNQALSLVITKGDLPIVYLSEEPGELSSSGLFIAGNGKEFRFTSCLKHGLEAELGGEEPSQLSLRKENEGFVLEFELKALPEALWNTVLSPETQISIFENVVEFRRKGSVLKMEIPSGLRMEVDFLSSAGGEVLPRLVLKVKTPGKFQLRFS